MTHSCSDVGARPTSEGAPGLLGKKQMLYPSLAQSQLSPCALPSFPHFPSGVAAGTPSSATIVGTNLSGLFVDGRGGWALCIVCGRD